MFAIVLSLLCSIRQGFRTRAAIQAEILALRHQLLVLQRSARAHKVRLTASDRFLWVWLSRLWREWRSALLIVKPETVIAWQQRGFRLYWSWKSRHPQGPHGSHFFREHRSPGYEPACHPKPKYLRQVEGNPCDAGATIWRTTGLGKTHKKPAGDPEQREIHDHLNSLSTEVEPQISTCKLRLNDRLC